MVYAAQITQTGSPDVIQWTEIDLPDPGADEVRMKMRAVGLNYIDTYQRSGLYPVELPFVLGTEGAGVIEAVGAGVTNVSPGDRVGTFGPSPGAYATERNVKADELVRLPDTISDRDAAALMLKGCTAEYLIERCAQVERGQTVLVYAAAGGVGHILLPWLKHLGAIVIAVVGSADKADAASQSGADHVIRHDAEDIAARVKEITEGKGVSIILDGVGKATWKASLDSAARRGLIVSYGNAGGQVDGVNLGILAQKGSLFVTRPTLFDYAATQQEKQAMVDRLFDMVAQGVVVADIGQTFPLQDAAEAHRAIEASETYGATVLLP